MKRKRINLAGLPISTLTFDETIKKIIDKIGSSFFIYCCTLNEIMMATEDIFFRTRLKSGDLLTPDGMPLVWYLKWKTGKGERVYGPDLMRSILQKDKVRHFFVGDKKNKKFFSKIGKYLVLPYKNEFNDDDYEFVLSKINKSKADLVWIGLGSKKQIMMASELKKKGLKKVVITVGAAFDFLSGIKMQAPKIIRMSGLEWIFRLINEPARLSGRYFKIILFLLSNFKKIFIGFLQSFF